MFLGADTDQLRTTATSFQSAADELVATFAAFGTNRANFAWSGPDADQYRTSLSVDVEGGARRLAKVFEAVAGELVQQAKQQDDVSTSIEAMVANILSMITGFFDGLFDGDSQPASLLPPAVERTEIWSLGGSAGAGDFLSGHGGGQFKIEYLEDGTVRVTELTEGGVGLGVGASAGAVLDTGDNEYGVHGSLSAEAVAMLQAGEARTFDSEADAMKYIAATAAAGGVSTMPIVGGPLSAGIGAIAGHTIDQGTLESSYVGVSADGSAAAMLHAIKWPGGAEVSFGQAIGVRTYMDGTVGFVHHTDAAAAGGYFANSGGAGGTAQFEVRVGDGQAVLHMQSVADVNGKMQLTEISTDLTGAPRAVVDAVARGDLGSVNDYLMQHSDVRTSSYSVQDQGVKIDAVVAGVEGTRVVISQN